MKQILNISMVHQIHNIVRSFSSSWSVESTNTSKWMLAERNRFTPRYVISWFCFPNWIFKIVFILIRLRLHMEMTWHPFLTDASVGGVCNLRHLYPLDNDIHGKVRLPPTRDEMMQDCQSIIIIIIWFGDTTTVSHLTKYNTNSKARAMSAYAGTPLARICLRGS